MSLKYADKYGKFLSHRFANGRFYIFDEKQNKVVPKIIWGFGITNDAGYWWSDKRKRWETYEEYQAAGKGGCCTNYRHKSLMNLIKFRRLLRQWSKYLPPGIEFILVSRYSLMDVTGKTQ